VWTVKSVRGCYCRRSSSASGGGPCTARMWSELLGSDPGVASCWSVSPASRPGMLAPTCSVSPHRGCRRSGRSRVLPGPAAAARPGLPAAGRGPLGGVVGLLGAELADAVKRVVGAAAVAGLLRWKSP